MITRLALRISALAAIAACATLLCGAPVPAHADDTSAPAVLTTGAGNGPDSGTYYIQSALGGTFVLDVSGASNSNGANVQVWESNKTAAQRWNVSRNTDGTYRIASASSGKVLDVAWGSAAPGANVQQWSANGTAAQRWRITRSGTGWAIAPVHAPSLRLDVSGARAASGSNVQVYSANGTVAQRWWLLPTKAPTAPARAIADGVYEFSPSHASALRMDLAGASASAGANVQVYTSNGSAAQRWAITRNSDGYYTVRSAATGTVVDVAGGSPCVGANAQAWPGNDTAAQRWAISRNSDGSFTLASKLSGNVLDVAGGSRTAGANVQLYASNGTAAQHWNLKEVVVLPEGCYTLRCAAGPVLDISGASRESGAAAQGWSANATFAQRFQVRSAGSGTVRIQSACSGLYLTEESGRVVQRPLSTQSASQLWKPTVGEGGLVFENMSSHRRLSLSSSAQGAAAVTAASSSAATQQWRVESRDLVPAGVYEIRNAGSGKALDVANGSLADGANIQQWAANGSGAQKFLLSPVGDGRYRITSDRSGRALDVQYASKANGANVQQWTSNGTAAQLWRPTLRADGTFELRNVGSGKALDVARGSKADGANVQQFTSNGTAAQGWVLVPTTSAGISGNAELDDYLRQIAGQCGYDLRKCFEYTMGIKAVSAMDSRILPYGIASDATSIEYALMVKRRGNSDCYGGASLFTWLARICGYDANFRVGGAYSASSGVEPHGWTEVYLNGKTYVCDPSLGRFHRQYNWYLITYDDAHTEYVLQ
ncbi:MAG: RICIN domain-containing protein [Eggerthellaceae bacterium]|nr:RICIN domain-containing protein [Eggerthellaceae bacterium]